MSSFAAKPCFVTPISSRRVLFLHLPHTAILSNLTANIDMSTIQNPSQSAGAKPARRLQRRGTIMTVGAGSALTVHDNVQAFVTLTCALETLKHCSSSVDASKKHCLFLDWLT